MELYRQNLKISGRNTGISWRKYRISWRNFLLFLPDKQYFSQKERQLIMEKNVDISLPALYSKCNPVWLNAGSDTVSVHKAKIQMKLAKYKGKIQPVRNQQFMSSLSVRG